MSELQTINGAKTVSIRKSNGALVQIVRTEVAAYLARGWELAGVNTVGNGVYNVVLSRENHPNRRAAYRVQDINGRFEHVVGKRAAYALACKWADCTPAGGLRPSDLPGFERDFGITITRVSAAVARSVGL